MNNSVFMILAQTGIPVPGPDQNPWAWVAFIAVVALGALFAKYDSSKDARIARSEKREDVLLDNSTTTTGIMREQSAATIKAAEIAEQAFQMGKMTHDLLAAFSSRVDAHHKEHAEQQFAILEALERLERGDKAPIAPQRRRT